MQENATGNQVRVQDTTANAGALGLLAFGMTTIILNLHNAGFYSMGSVVFAMGIFYGGLAQVIVGIMEWKKNNTFGTVAFTSYGFFWIALVFMMLMPTLGWAPALPKEALIAYLALWGLFSLVMFVITFGLSKALQVVFGLLTLLFILLVAGNALGSETILHIAGVVGIICGLSAMYTGLAEVMNEVYKKKIAPLG
jgi:succinate-acetate transporter protein